MSIFVDKAGSSSIRSIVQSISMQLNFQGAFISNFIVMIGLLCSGSGICQSPAVATEAPALRWSRGEMAYVVATPETALEKRVVKRLSDYLSQVLRCENKVVSNLSSVPGNRPAILLSANAINKQKVGSSPEAYNIETSIIGKHPVVRLSGNSALGLKQAVQRLLIKSSQDALGLAIPPLHLNESPWIARREWTLCPWSPNLVRGVFNNPNADKRLNVWLYSNQQIKQYANMFDAFGFSGCQLMETVASYSILGSPEAFQDRQMKFAEAVRANGQQLTLWVWAAQFNDYGWYDSSVTYTPQKGYTAFTDPKVRAGFEKYYNGYAKMAPYVDMLITHFYDPGSLKNRNDIFNYMRLLVGKFKAKNPAVQLGVDFWASDSDSAYMKQLVDNGFKDALLLESSMPHLYPPGEREHLHAEAKKQNLKIGVWGWHTAEIETDQNPMMHVNAKLLKNFYQQIKNGVDKIQPLSYWSEMEAYHLNNIFTQYAASQLLWNPDRDADEILREIAEGIWGPRNGPAILDAIQLIQDVRSGPTWDTYWIWSKQHRLGTPDAHSDLKRAENAIAALGNMQTDTSFVPKFPLPFPPSVFVELMLPHLWQIRQFAESRIEVDKIREAAGKGTSKQALKKMIEAAWKPVREYNTWVGMFGTLEAAKQEKMFLDLGKELEVEVQTPGWIRWRDANRLLQVLQNRQRSFKEPFTFKADAPVLWRAFNWTKEKGLDRLKLLQENGCVSNNSDGTSQLTNWEEYRRK
ncbi:hypothetical protein [Flavisolibacter ginsenosidimutans]|uniref:Beta-hexosaminidase bacterial type N-terminal domain-containing protein n=1 Tax=Flavisolibacter ginsenosidimutans TaxID=661481 RepID=A0A5B8UCK8_9BACT|nr:hypothetical protein [Flavisolibacter ginsenosidimutans]QEC54381.1 hypothetical protein FSB75_00165 [Flavisolibacter ginsenosidimutans]